MPQPDDLVWVDPDGLVHIDDCPRGHLSAVHPLSVGTVWKDLSNAAHLCEVCFPPQLDIDQHVYLDQISGVYHACTHLDPELDYVCVTLKYLYEGIATRCDDCL